MPCKLHIRCPAAIYDLLALERRLKARRQAEASEEEFHPIRRGWCFGSVNFRQKMLALAGDNLGPSHTGDLRQESAGAKAERIVLEELRARKLMEDEFKLRRKGDPVKIGAFHPVAAGNHGDAEPHRRAGGLGDLQKRQRSPSQMDAWHQPTRPASGQ